MKHMWTAVAALVTMAGVTSGTAGSFDQYLGGGTLVVKEGEQSPLLDDGKVVCNKSSPEPSLGGGCVLFGPWDSILVTDKVGGNAVAFQVCIDNDGDQRCGGRGQDPTGAFCSDDIFFSHDDKGNFFNPLGPLPQWFRQGCPGGPWPGYVVFLCEGVHATGLPHQHAAVEGSIVGTVGGTGFGDFCQPPHNGTAKEYILN